MDLMDLLILLLLFPSTPALALLRKFQFVNLMKTWAEAQSYCREKFADLATIDNAEDWARVSEIVRNSGQQYVWIGLYDAVKSWRWSLDNTSLYEQDFGSWLVLNMNNNLSREHCAFIYQGILYDNNCEGELWSVCYDETSNSYITVTDLKSWQSAQSYCRQTYTDLASIRNQQEWKNVTDAITTAGRHWIGLSRERWKWSDQSDSSFRKWKSGQPDGGTQTCGLAHVLGLFDWYCNNKIPFICTVPQKKVLKVMVKTSGSVNLTDPLVQEAVLKQMEKDLRGQGVHQEFRLSWRKQPRGDVFKKTQL